MQDNNKNCCNNNNSKTNNQSKKRTASNCSKANDKNASHPQSKIPVYINKNNSCTPRTSVQQVNKIPNISCCSHDRNAPSTSSAQETKKKSSCETENLKNIDSHKSVCCSKTQQLENNVEVNLGLSEKPSSKLIICYPHDCSKKSQEKLLKTLSSSSKNMKCTKSKNVSNNTCQSQKSMQYNEYDNVEPNTTETVFNIGKLQVFCNKSSKRFETSDTKEIEHITTVNIAANKACKKPETNKCPRCCANSKSDEEKRIVLPEVQVDIGPQKIQKIQIDVQPTEMNTKSSGIITIPVQLRFKKQSSSDPPQKVPCCSKPTKSISSIPDFKKKHTLVYEACDKNEYFQETYMDELADEYLKIVTIAKMPEEYMEKFPIIQEPENPEFVVIEEDMNEIEKDEVVEVQGIPWYQTIENDNYVEPYLQEGYCTTGDNVEVQTDLVLGLKLLSESLNSVSENISQRTHGRSSSKFICRCGTASELIDWQTVFLPSVDTIKIQSIEQNITETEEDEEGEIPNITLFSEPPGTNIPNAEIEEPELVPLPEKYNFVYKSNNEPYEPYLQTLLKQFPDKQFELDYNNDDNEIQLPWKTFLLPVGMKIRKIKKLKFIKKRPVCCISAPCVYGGCAKGFASCTCVGGPLSVGNLNSLLNYTNSEKSLINSLPCPYHGIPNTSILGSKSAGNNNNRCKALTNQAKQKEFSTKITYNVPQNFDTKMSTKVTFKDNNDYINSPYLSTAMNITPKSSQSVTYKYLNTNMLQETEESKTEILCSLCDNSKCDYRKNIEQPVTCTPCKPSPPLPTIQMKPDPVVAAFQACEAELKPVREALIQVQRKLKNLHMPELECMFKEDSNEFYDVPSFKCQCPPCGCQFNPNQWHKKPPCSKKSKSKSISIKSSSSKHSVKNKSRTKRNKAIQKTGQYKKLKCIESCKQDKCSAFKHSASNELLKKSKRDKCIQKSGSKYKKLRYNDTKSNKYSELSDDNNKYNYSSKNVKSLYTKFPCNISKCSQSQTSGEYYQIDSQTNTSQYSSKNKKSSNCSVSSKKSQNTIYYSTSSSPSDRCVKNSCSKSKKKLKVHRRITSPNPLAVNPSSPCPFLQFIMDKKSP